MLKSRRKNGITSFYETNNAETLLPLAPIFEDDFWGAALNEKTWTKYTAGAAPPTQLIITGENGVCALTMTNDVEAQICGIYFGTIYPFRLDRGPVFEARVRWTTLPAEATKMTAVVGLASATQADIDNVADSVWFRWDGEGLGLMTVESDDVSANETSKVATGITSEINKWQILKIDLTVPTAVKFYINGLQVAKTTTFNVSTDPDQEYQVYFRLDKSADAGDLGVMEIDYVKVWETRD
jgi:hypothetical protein